MAIRIRRTLGSGPPPDLQFGELAYSNADQRLWIGRPTGQPPASIPLLEQGTARFVLGGLRITSLGARVCHR